MSSRKSSLTRFLLALCCYLCWIPSLFSDSSYTGRSLEEALRDMQQKGLNILFSSDMVRPDMVVEKEPVSAALRQKLEELLEPHGLKWVRGPKDTLLVVERVEKPGVPPEQVPTHRALPEMASYIMVPFVTLYVTAQNHDGDFVTKLTAEHFTLKEDGKEQQILDFLNLSEPKESNEKLPVTFFFLMDISQSTTRAQDQVRNCDLFREAALALSEKLRPEDQAMLITFNNDLRNIQDMTKDKKAFQIELRGIQETGGKTAMFDSILRVLDEARHYSGRKVVVIFSDGDDNESKASLEELLAALKSSDVTVFALGRGSSYPLWEKGAHMLERITEVSGGYGYFPKSMTDVAAMTEEMHKAIMSQYAAGYVPPDPSLRKWRQVELKCRVPGIRLRYRKSYLF